MQIIDLLEELNLHPKRKASTHGGEYCSPCPFCREGEDRFLTWPQRHNNSGEYQGGRFSCRKCRKYGDAISFLRQLYGLSYQEACKRLRIEPKQRNSVPFPKLVLKPKIVEEPSDLWKEKANSFVEWSHKQLLSNNEGLSLLKARGFNDELADRFVLGYNPQTFFRERTNWGLTQEIKEDGKTRKLWLPAGLVISTFSDDGIVKVKIRRSEWKEGDKFPKYVEVSGSKQTPSIYGDTSLPLALILESELDALLIQQEAGDLVYCIALGGSTKPLDAETDQLLRKATLILFLPDFDDAGAIAWMKWKKMFSTIQRILTPCEKSAGDYFKSSGNLREWLVDTIQEIQRKAMRG
jgi:hypothetical protein